MKAWKVRKLFEDVVWDLRNRGLLPIVALLVVAMVVLPVMIMSGGKEAPSGGPAAIGDVSAPEAETAVLAYSPGVREYKKRLADLAAKDPFKQHFATTSSAAALSTTVASTLSGGGGTSSSEVSGGEVSSGGGGGGGGKTRTIVRTKFVSYDLDVAVGEAGAMNIRNDVPQLSFLPSESKPVLVFLGISEGGGKAMFLVSSDVSAASGEGSCMPSGSAPCEILVLRRGQVENLTYDPDGKVYRIKVLSIDKSTS